MRQVSWETRYLWTKKYSGSCRCVWRKSRIKRNSCNNVTCFSNGCSNVGSLVDSNLAIEVLLEGSWRQSYPCVDARVTLRRLPRDHTRTTLSSPGLPEIVRLCRRPSGPKPEIQHNQRGRGVPTLTWDKEEVTIKEGKSRCCSFTKKEIMRLKKGLQMKNNGACY